MIGLAKMKSVALVSHSREWRLVDFGPIKPGKAVAARQS